MKPNKKILLTLCAAVAVAITPFAVADSPEECGAMGHHGRPDLTRMLTHSLNLSDAQQTQVKTLVAEVQPQARCDPSASSTGSRRDHEATEHKDSAALDTLTSKEA
jgi:Spy/CpxP family protein refolding chaperone